MSKATQDDEAFQKAFKIQEDSVQYLKQTDVIVVPKQTKMLLALHAIGKRMLEESNAHQPRPSSKKKKL